MAKHLKRINRPSSDHRVNRPSLSCEDANFYFPRQDDIEPTKLEGTNGNPAQEKRDVA